MTGGSLTAASLVVGDRILEGFAQDGTPLIHEDAALLIEAGRVVEIGPRAAMEKAHAHAARIGGTGKIVIPGLINAHHHVGLTPFQLGSPDHPLELWFASRLALRDIDLRLDTLFSAFEMIASGVTSVQHLQSRAPGDGEAVLGAGRKVIDAYREIGMRASCSMAFRDQNRLVYQDDSKFTQSLPEDLRPAMHAYFQRFPLSLAQQRDVFEGLLAETAGDPRLKVQIAPANLHWLTDEALLLSAELLERHQLPVHMHLLETPYQKEYARRRTGGSALSYLAQFGLLNERLTIGHGVWMSEDDVRLSAASGVHVCHNCSSNFRLKSGIAPVNRFMAQEVKVAIGIDEAGMNDDRDMLQEMRLVLRAHREPGIDSPHPTCAQVLRMATEHGAATTPFGDRIGSLRPGSEADLVLLDWKTITWPYQDADSPLVDVILHRAKREAVETVMVAGEIIYHEGAFLRVYRKAILEAIAESLSRPLSAAEEDRRRLAEAVFPHVKKFYDHWLPKEPGAPHTHYNARF